MYIPVGITRIMRLDSSCFVANCQSIVGHCLEVINSSGIPLHAGSYGDDDDDDGGGDGDGDGDGEGDDDDDGDGSCYG